MIIQSSLCSGGDGHEVTFGEKGGGGAVGGHNSEGGNVQQFGTKRGQGNRNWIQKRRESLKGFPFSANLVCECASPPLPLTLP